MFLHQNDSNNEKDLWEKLDRKWTISNLLTVLYEQSDNLKNDNWQWCAGLISLSLYPSRKLNQRTICHFPELRLL